MKPKRLGNRMILLYPSEDQSSFYYPVCTYNMHQGILTSREEKRCMRKRCRYYVRFRDERQSFIKPENLDRITHDTLEGVCESWMMGNPDIEGQQRA